MLRVHTVLQAVLRLEGSHRQTIVPHRPPQQFPLGHGVRPKLFDLLAAQRYVDPRNL